MSLQGNKINLSVNGKSILAENVSINDSSPQRALYSLNNNTPYNVVPSKINSSISISYFLEPGNDPNYTTLTGLINIGENFITGYLNSFSFQLQPNSLVKVATDFSVYYSFSGNLSGQKLNDWNNYDTNNASGLAHYWSAQILSGTTQISDNKVLQMDYSAAIDLIPIYSLGDPLPKQIFYNKVTESTNILSEQQFNTKYSGQLIDNILNGVQTLKLRNISSIFSNTINSGISIPLTGFTLQDVKTDIQPDNLVFFNFSFNRFS